MNRRSELEHEISLLQKKIKEAPKNTPQDLRAIWDKELVDMELELNNLYDDDEDRNDR